MPVFFWLDITALSISTVIATSLMLTALETAPRRALNRSFVLFALSEATWAISSLLLRLALWLGVGDPLLLSELATLAFALMGPLLLVFAVHYLDRPSRGIFLVTSLGLAVVVALSVPLFDGQLVFNPRLDANGSTVMDVSNWGFAAAAVPATCMVWSLLFFWQERRRAGELYLALSVLTLLAGFAVGGILEVRFPVLSVTNTLSIAVLGYGLVRRQLFDPLRERTVELEREIAERGRTEASLRKSEERWRTYFEQANDLIFVLDASGRLISVNRAVCKATGYGAEELLGKNPLEFSVPELEGSAKEALSRILRGRENDECEWQILTKDERILWLEIRGGCVHESNHHVETLLIGRDITGRKQAEAERGHLLAQIQEQAHQIQQTVNTVPEGVILLDGERQVVLANPAAREYLATLAGIKVGQVLSHLGNRPLAELLTSPPKGLWHETETAGPPRRFFEVIGRPIESGPRTDGWVLVLRDVTQERDIQQRILQQERLAAVGQLAAGIAHDFNNIMAVIVLYARMSLRMPDLPSNVHRHLETVSRQAKRASELIQQILDFSRRTVLERRPMDLVPFLKEQVRLLERTLPEHIQIDLAYGSDEYTAEADPTRMQQMIMNLALNARDAMPEGGKLRIGLDRINIRCRKEAPLSEMSPGDWVRVTVSDTGTGISPDVLPHVFDPFFTTKALGEGTGLGLAQVWGIVKQHEGHIDVATTVGQGTTFTLYLPALIVNEPETLPEEGGIVVEGRGETILAVEDNPATRKALVDILELLNYRVLEAANGREALAILEEGQEAIELVLSDVVMPEIGGMALFRAMRQRGLSVPMVMMTGHPMEDELKNLQAQGLSGWLLKPPSPEQLAQIVTQALRENSNRTVSASDGARSE